MNTKQNGASLPSGVTAKDIKWPSYSSKERLASDVGDHGALDFYEVKGSGWVLLTLRIGGGRRVFGGESERYYGIRVSDGSPVRVGRGPHVLRKLRVYVRENRRKALEHLTNLYIKGLESAHVTRDRISSRRFQGQVNRANGLHSWRWN